MVEIGINMNQVYWGQHPCQGVKANGLPCENVAYYRVTDKLLCGVHSTRRKQERTELPRDPAAGEHKEQERMEHVRKCHAMAAVKRAAGIKGKVTLYKMRMMKNVGFVEGVTNVFPNFKHGGRTDGFGLPSLSPKSIGPVTHPQPGLPVARNLENFHQGNKVFPSEVDEKDEVRDVFFETQRQMYEDPTPHRHKEAAQGKNVPLFSLWVTPDGTRHRISYFVSRQFYCVYYERATRENPDFHRLKSMIDDGYDLRICGYDAYEVADSSAAGLEACYCDVSRPFGHELVLYTMLVAPEEDWPWRKYVTFAF